MQMKSIQDLLTIGMSYVLDAEQQLSKESKKMADATEDPQVKEMFSKSVTQGEKYAERVKAAFGKLGKDVKTEDNHITNAMVKEVEGMISSSEKGAVRDAALVIAFNQQQAYRVASYGSLKTYAELIGKGDVVRDLAQSLEESKAGDEKLTKIAEETVNPKAARQPVAA